MLPSTSTSAPEPAHKSYSVVPLQLPRKITLDEFCQRYEISAQDQAKLATLDVVPGDHDALCGLEREDWAAVGFAKLAWDRFLKKHMQFMEDVRDGLWM